MKKQNKVVIVGITLLFFLIPLLQNNTNTSFHDPLSNTSQSINLNVEISESFFANFGNVGSNVTTNHFNIDHEGWYGKNFTIFFDNITGQDACKVIQDKTTKFEEKGFTYISDHDLGYNPFAGGEIQQHEISQSFQFDYNVHLDGMEYEFQYTDDEGLEERQYTTRNISVELRTDDSNQPHKTSNFFTDQLNNSIIIGDGRSLDEFLEHNTRYDDLFLKTSVQQSLTSDTKYWFVFNGTYEDNNPDGDYSYYGLWVYYDPTESIGRSTNRSLSECPSGDASDLYFRKGSPSGDYTQNSSFHPYLKLYYRITDYLTPEQIGFNVTSPIHASVSNSKFVTLENINSVNITSFDTNANESVQYWVNANGTLTREYSKESESKYTINENYVNWTIDIPIDELTDDFYHSGRNLSLNLPSEFYEWEIVNSSLTNLPTESHIIRIVANSSNRVAFIDVEERVKRGSQNSMKISGIGTEDVNVSIYNTSNGLAWSNIESMNTDFDFIISEDHALGMYTINVSYNKSYEIGFKSKTFKIYDNDDVDITIQDTSPFGNRNIPNTEVSLNNGSTTYIKQTNSNGDPLTFENIEIGVWYYVNWSLYGNKQADLIFVEDGSANNFVSISSQAYYFTTDIEVNVFQQDGFTPLSCKILLNETQKDAPFGSADFVGFDEAIYNVSVYYNEEIVNTTIFEVWDWGNNNTINVYTQILDEYTLTLTMKDSLYRNINGLNVSIANSTNIISNSQVTNENGLISFGGLPIGTYNVSWTNQNENVYWKHIEIEDNTVETIVIGEMWLFPISPNFIIKDTTFDEYGDRNFGIQSEVELNNTRLSTNENGEVLFMSLTEGVYNISVFYEDTLIFSDTITLRKENATNIEIITEYDGHAFLHQQEITAYFFDIYNRPIPNTNIIILNDYFTYYGITNENGIMVMDNVEFGEYDVIWITDGVMQNKTLHVPFSDQIKNFNATSQYRYNVSVFLVIKDINSRGFRVFVELGNESLSGWTNENGEITFYNIEEGFYEVRVIYNGTILIEDAIEIRKGDMQNYEVTTSINAHPPDYQMPIWGWFLIGLVSILGVLRIRSVKRKHKLEERERTMKKMWGEYKQLYEDEQNIRAVLITHNKSGSLISQWTHKLSVLEDGDKSDLVSGFLDAISKWGREMDWDKPLRKIQWGEYTMFMNRGDYITLTIVSDQELFSQEIHKRIDYVKEMLEKNHEKDFELFNGNVRPFRKLHVSVESTLRLNHQYKFLVNEFNLSKTNEKIRSYLYEMKDKEMYLIDFVEYVEKNVTMVDQLYHWIYLAIIDDVIKFEKTLS